MAKDINTSSLMATAAATEIEADERSTVIDVDHVSMVFNIANQQLNNLKEYAIALMRRELMFKEFIALDDVSLQVKKGDVFGILGTNGSGKSTLLKIIAGVLEPTRGTVTIHGTIAPLIELGAGFDFELTARENIYLNGALLGYPRKFIDEHFDDIVDFAEIGDFLDMPIKNYSSGMVARIAFAIATVIVPDILIVDEVLSVGDFMFQQKCEQKIQSLINEHGVTVLIVSHNNDQIERLCNKAIWIEKGHTRIIGTAEEVCSIYRALGGHSGSAESEAVICDILQGDDSEAIPHRTIAGSTLFGTAAKLLAETRFPNTTDCVVASSENVLAQILAAGLAGCLQAPFVYVKPDEIPEETFTTLKHFAPERLIVLDEDNELSESMRNDLRDIVGSEEHIVVLSGADIRTLSERARAFATDEDREPAALAASSQDPSILAKQVARIYGDGIIVDFEASPEAIDRPASARDAAACTLIGTLFSLPDVIAAAPFAAQEQANIIFTDHNDLDSMVEAVAALQSQDALNKLVFIGGNYWFNDSDKTILSRAQGRKLQNEHRQHRHTGL